MLEDSRIKSQNTTPPQEIITDSIRETNRIFISHSKYDHEDVYLIVNFLKGKNIRCWYDTELKEKPGCHFWDEIEQRIKESQVFIILLSQYSLLSSAVQKEYKIAKKSIKKIIPIILDKAVLDFTDHLEEKFKDIFTNQYIKTQFDKNYILKSKGNYDIYEYQKGLLALVENLVGVSLEATIGLVPFYNESLEIVGLTSRHFLHFIPNVFHRSVIVILVREIIDPEMENVQHKIIVQIKPKKKERYSGSLAFFGGHHEINESCTEVAIREISEEINIPKSEVLKQPLIRIGNEDEFCWQASSNRPHLTKKTRYNYEFSTLYVYHLDPNRKYFFEETLGTQIIPVNTISIDLSRLHSYYDEGFGIPKSKSLENFTKFVSGINDEVIQMMQEQSDEIRFSDDIIRLFGGSNIGFHINESYQSNYKPEDYQKMAEVWKNKWKDAIEDAISNSNQENKHQFCTRISI